MIMGRGIYAPINGVSKMDYLYYIFYKLFLGLVRMTCKPRVKYYASLAQKLIHNEAFSEGYRFTVRASIIQQQGVQKYICSPAINLLINTIVEDMQDNHLSVLRDNIYSSYSNYKKYAKIFKGNSAYDFYKVITENQPVLMTTYQYSGHPIYSIVNQSLINSQRPVLNLTGLI